MLLCKYFWHDISYILSYNLAGTWVFEKFASHFADDKNISKFVLR